MLEEVDPKIRELIKSCIVYKPEERPSIDEVLKVICEILNINEDEGEIVLQIEEDIGQRPIRQDVGTVRQVNLNLRHHQ